MKRRRVVLSMIFMMILFCSRPSVSAQETGNNPEIQPLFIYVNSTTEGLNISNSGLAECSCTVWADPDRVIKIVAYMYLQKKNAQGNYENIISWEKTVDLDYIGFSKSYQLSSGGTYRAMMIYNVYHKPMQYEVIQAYSMETGYVK